MKESPCRAEGGTARDFVLNLIRNRQSIRRIFDETFSECIDCFYVLASAAIAADDMKKGDEKATEAKEGKAKGNGKTKTEAKDAKAKDAKAKSKDGDAKGESETKGEGKVTKGEGKKSETK
jgi:chromatin remodeling complex protein RSC6